MLIDGKIGKNRYFNPYGDEMLNESLIGANPTGYIDYNRSKFSFASNAYKIMEANTWTMQEVNTSGEAKNFKSLSDSEKRLYELVLAQLSFNDSVQSFQLVDYSQVITNSVVRSAIIKQSEQEVLHSKSYAVCLEATENSDKVFDLFRSDLMLQEKNYHISENYLMHQKRNDIDELFLWAGHNQMLEGIYFLSGFAGVYLLGDKVQATSEMINFIQRDEINAHLPFFSNLINTIKKEHNISSKVIDDYIKMVDDAVKLEIAWFKYIVKDGILGTSELEIENAIKYWGNKRLNAIGINPIYGDIKANSIVKLVETKGKFNETRTNFFEGTSRNYSKASIKMDF